MTAAVVMFAWDCMAAAVMVAYVRLACDLLRVVMEAEVTSTCDRKAAAVVFASVGMACNLLSVSGSSGTSTGDCMVAAVMFAFVCVACDLASAVMETAAMFACE